MKKIFTLLLLSSTLCSISQHKIEKHKFAETADNYEFMMYYPVFKSGKSSDLLNKFTLESFVKENPVKKHNITVSDTDHIQKMMLTSASMLKKEGLTKSIEPIMFKAFSNWHFYDSPKVISYIIDQYIILGRENLLMSTSVINIDPKDGKTFKLKDYIIDSVNLIEDVAEQFCKDGGLPKNAPRLLTGLKYELANLPLAKKIGFSDIGIVFFYGRGEIANIGYPPIRIEVPYKKIFDNFAPSMLSQTYSDSDGEKVTEKRIKELVKDSKKVKKAKKRK